MFSRLCLWNMRSVLYFVNINFEIPSKSEKNISFGKTHEPIPQRSPCRTDRVDKLSHWALRASVIRALEALPPLGLWCISHILY
jgi:hypothetical protein